MALFFDQTWFDVKLAERGLSRSDIGRLLALAPEQIGEIWKDQRELSVHEVSALAMVLGVTPAEIALKAGVSTPVPREAEPGLAVLDAKLDAILERLTKLEQDMRALKLDISLSHRAAQWPVSPDS